MNIILRYSNIIHKIPRYFSMMAAAAANVPKIKMIDGREMPALALGTYLGYDEKGIMTSENKQLRDVVHSAIDMGYRHIDTAAVYQTEDEIGEAIENRIANKVITRDDIFVTTKVWNTHHRREQVVEALRTSLKKLKLDYVDLYLVHWPISLNEDYTYANIDIMDTWRGMEDAQKVGLTKSIGLSNFNKDQIERVFKEGTIKPVALQIEVHPQIAQQDLVSYAQSKGLVVMGYSPFGSLVYRFGMEAGGPKINDPILVEIANKYNKTTPQVLLRWLVDRKIVPIPKTIKINRLAENINIFDFKLTEEEIKKVYSFDAHKRFTLPSFWQNHPNYPFEKVDNPVADPFAKTT